MKFWLCPLSFLNEFSLSSYNWNNLGQEMGHLPHGCAGWCSYMSCSLAQGFSNWDGQVNLTGILLKSRFRFGLFKMGLRFCIYNQLPGGADAVSLGTNCGLQEHRLLSDTVSHQALWFRDRSPEAPWLCGPQTNKSKLPKAKTKVCLKSDSGLQIQVR